MRLPKINKVTITVIRHVLSLILVVSRFASAKLSSQSVKTRRNLCHALFVHAVDVLLLPFDLILNGLDVGDHRP